MINKHIWKTPQNTTDIKKYQVEILKYRKRILELEAKLRIEKSRVQELTEQLARKTRG